MHLLFVNTFIALLFYKTASDCGYAVTLSREIIPVGQCIKYPLQNYSYMLFCDQYTMKTISWNSNSECLGQNNTAIGAETPVQESCKFGSDCEILYVDIYQDNFQYNHDTFDYWGNFYGDCSTQNDGAVILQMPFIVNQCLPGSNSNTSELWFYDGFDTFMLKLWKNTDCAGPRYDTLWLTCDGYTIYMDYIYPTPPIQEIVIYSKTDTSWVLFAEIALGILLFFVMCFLLYRCFKRRKQKKQYELIKHKLKNPLVAIVGIAEYHNDIDNNCEDNKNDESNKNNEQYQQLQPLMGVTIDTTNLMTLWVNTYGYDAHCFNDDKFKNDQDNAYKCTKREFEGFMDNIINMMSIEVETEYDDDDEYNDDDENDDDIKKKQRQYEEIEDVDMKNHEYDSLILCCSCHGGKDKIISSDLKPIFIIDIIKRVQSGIKLSNKDIPVILIIDACRGQKTVGLSRDTKYLLNYDEMHNENINNLWYNNKYENFLILYSTTEGTVSREIPNYGSFFIQSLCETLNKPSSLRIDLQKLVETEINTLLMKKSENTQHAQWESSVSGGICLEKVK